MSIFFPILASTLLGVAGQVILKIGMTSMGRVAASRRPGLPGLLLSLTTNYYVIGGLLIYGMGVFFWLIALSRAPLSYAYPFASLSYALITVTSFFILHENIDWLRLAGIVTICSGVLIVAAS